MKREKLKDTLAEQMRIWREGKVKLSEDKTIGILDQDIKNEDLAESLIQLTETVIGKIE